MISSRVTRPALAALSRQGAVASVRSSVSAPFVGASRKLHSSPAVRKEFDHPVATLDSSAAAKLPLSSTVLFEAKKAKRLTFEDIGKALGRDEVACAALFYGQAKASEEDIKNLASVLSLPADELQESMYGWPDRGRSIDMPPKEPLMYRLYEIVQNYGYAYKAVINEKFGDGIMSAISYSTKVEKEKDEKGEWVKITLRGKWLPYTRF